AEARDVHAQNVDLVLVTLSPDAREQIFLENNLTDVLGELGEKPVLGDGEGNRAPVDAHGSGPVVDLEPAISERHRGDVRLHLAGSTKHGRNACKQLARGKGLRHIIVGTGLKSRYDVLLIVNAREDDDGRPAELPQAGQDRPSVHAWHAQVEDEQIGPVGAHEVERASTRAGGHDAVATALQVPLEEPKNSWVVVDDANQCARRSLIRPHLRPPFHAQTVRAALPASPREGAAARGEITSHDFWPRALVPSRV